MTMPTLITKHQKKVVVTRLQKFYTNINQAIKLSEVDNGNSAYWDMHNEVGVVNTYEENEKFFKKYLAPYLKVVKIGKKSKIIPNTENGADTDMEEISVMAIFADGSAMTLAFNNGAMGIYFYPQGVKAFTGTKLDYARDSFAFNFAGINTIGVKSFVEPYTQQWDGTRENLISHPRYGCNKSHAVYGNYCAKLIQYDGWQISDDYPW